MCRGTSCTAKFETSQKRDQHEQSCESAQIAATRRWLQKVARKANDQDLLDKLAQDPVLIELRKRAEEAQRAEGIIP